MPENKCKRPWGNTSASNGAVNLPRMSKRPMHPSASPSDSAVPTLNPEVGVRGVDVDTDVDAAADAEPKR